MTKPRPFNIRIFVAEGLPEGLRFVEKSNWVGLGIVCPRGRYPEVKKRDEFSKSAVYLLMGHEGDDDRPKIYIGEADSVRERLDNHHAKKDFWQQAIVFTTKGDPLNKAEVQYLESRLVELATEAKRCLLDNGNVPKRPGLSEADEAQIEGYLEEMLSLLPVLGIHVFATARSGLKADLMYYWKGSGWNATGYVTSAGFMVKAGSVVRGTTAPSMEKHIPRDFKRRQQLIHDGILVTDGNAYRFAIDYEFSSPSLAATICAGRSANGRTEWKDAKGITLKEHQEKEAQA